MKTNMKKTKNPTVRRTALAAPPIFAFAFVAKTVHGLSDVDAVGTIKNLTDFIMLILRFGGVLAVVFGFVQFMLSLQSHDPSQRTAAMLGIIGGVVLIALPSVLRVIGVSW